MTGTLLLAAVLLLPTGCVSLPESGPLTPVAPAGDQPTRRANYYDPPPPQPRASAADIVRGFLDAMRQTPISPQGAKLYLASGFAGTWDFAAQTIVYAPGPPPRGQGDQVVVDLTSADHLDRSGHWLGPLGPARSRLDFHLVKQDGQWRIDQAPDALVVPQTWFATRYTQKSLYFFDPTAKILVPEPVFVPSGPQSATSLVQGLLAGPPKGKTKPTLQGFFPQGTTVGLSVPVSADGVADVELTGDVSPPSDVRLRLLTAQLTWTLRQDAITELGLTIGGRQIRLSGGRTRVRTDGSPAYDPAGFAASGALFGLRDGVVVTGGTPTTLHPVAGPLGRRPRGLSSVAVDLDATYAAGVCAGGTAIVLAPLAAGQPGPDGKPATIRTIVSGATDLLRPAWDFGNHIWYVDRSGGHARVWFTGGGHVRRLVSAPGISGHDVRRFLVSRDGSRLVAVVHRDNADAVLVSRIRHDDHDRILGLTPARQISLPDGVERIQDIGWSSPTTMFLLSRLADSAIVRTVAVDGAPTGSDAQDVTVNTRLSRLVTSPASPTDDPLVLTEEREQPGRRRVLGVVPISGPDGATQPVDQAVTDLHYVG